MSNAKHPLAPQAETFGVTDPGNSERPVRSDQVEACRQQLATFVREQPMTAVMAMFAVGLGAGLLAVQAITQSESRSRTQQLTDRISRAVRDALPHSLR